VGAPPPHLRDAGKLSNEQLISGNKSADRVAAIAFAKSRHWNN